ncbi:hypothetical protein [Streptomyces populi]|uniref:hypothetical protein n=1 Tax=Streptomyces populi TaxID=2058924 RepID=UPI0013A6B1D4|nr:hypothetical protein [Streptomyces populi]
MADNPLEAAAFGDGPTLDDAAMRQARHAEAAPLLADSLTTAAHHLELCTTCCHYTASGIVRDLKDHPEHRPPLPQLTDAQYAALGKIAQGGARSYTRRGGADSVRAGDGKAIHAKPFGVLEKYLLIRIDNGTSAFAGKDIRITAAGKLVLDLQKPARSQATPPGKVPAPGNTGGRRR